MIDLQSLRVWDQLYASKFKTKKKKRLVTNPLALLASHRLLPKEGPTYLQLRSGGDSRGRWMKERSPLELSIFAADVNLQSGARPRASRRNAQTIYREDLQPLPYPKFEYTAQSIISPTQEMSLVGPGATTFLHVGLERKPLGTKHYNSKTLHDIDNVT
jgi:hypothetical protein